MNDLARDLASALDPVRLAERLSMSPHAWQIKALRSTARRSLWLCARQVGKTTTAAVLALHFAVYVPGSTVIIASPSQRQSTEAFRRVAGFYRRLGRPVVAESENLSSLTLESGSRVISVPGGTGGDTVRGYSAVNLAIVDEASRVDDSLIETLGPMLRLDGRLLMLTTPAGRRGLFYDLWEHGGRDWERVRVPATDSPLWTKAALNEQRELIGDFAFRQEFELAFVSDEGALFPADLITAAIDPDVKPLDLHSHKEAIA